MLDLGFVKKDFTSLIGNVHPWMLSHFVMWLDIKVAEYKVYGHMVLDDTANDTPQWLRGNKSSDVTSIEKSHENEESMSHSDGSSGRPIQSFVEDSPSPSKQTRLSTSSSLNQTHDQGSFPQSHQTPQRQISPYSHTHQSLPTLVKHSPMYRKEKPTASEPHSENKMLSCDDESRLAHYRTKQFMDMIEERDFTQGLRNTKVSQIQLQERWSHEIEKSVNKSGVIKDRSLSSQSSFDPVQASKQDLPSETLSRSTIVLNEPTEHIKELQKRLSYAGSQEVPGKNPGNISSESTIQEIIKIELSSDEESQTGNSESHQGEIISLDTGQTETNLDGCMGFDPNDHLLQETNLKELADVNIPVPVTLYSNDIRLTNQINAGSGMEEEASWKSKKWEYFEKLRKSRGSSYMGARVHSQSLQTVLPFPDPFPLENLPYGARAKEMINTGIVSRPGKMQFLDTIFNEVVKYTGLYPTPQQKVEVAKAIVTTFPKLDQKTNPGQASSLDSWGTVLSDKYRNERRLLNHGQFYRKPINYVSPWKKRQKISQRHTYTLARHSEETPEIQEFQEEAQNLNLELPDDELSNAISEQLHTLVSRTMGDNSVMDIDIKTEPVIMIEPGGQ
ncbi:Hypothetical predicted protein [Mytilus galloprovincialis]|uniref:Uncharacterized protein n=1 Tax=Mytilus galloprovincialis TaxID=29158 RepID=A0A8B6E911_MYTGA|nr:Hypothetical predicted protein [Mytilus galloprovincialis]